jgi:hypothetical protein
MNRHIEFPIDPELVDKRSCESLFKEFLQKPPPLVKKHQELQRDFNRKLKTMNNSIGKEMHVIDTSFEHNFKYLEDA